jgi:arsenite-transporting ATPase
VARIIVVSGKGGVGKTTVAAATGVAAAERGYRTLVMSIDIAHSLSDSFDLKRTLFDQHEGEPERILPNLDVQEIDAQADIQRHWRDVHRYVAELFLNTGLDRAVAEEVAIIPGMEDVIALMYVNRYVRDDAYDLIVLDAPPTGESLRFVNIQATIEWYMRRRFKLDRGLVKYAGPLLGMLADMPLPEDGYFAGLQRMFERLQGVDQLLRDPSVTSVRLVTNAEKMVVRETQRAYMYFSLYGMTTDRVVVNRLLPPDAASDGYFARWAADQQGYLAEMRGYFEPVPLVTLPLFREEVVGIDRLRAVAGVLHGDDDPVGIGMNEPPFRFEALPSGGFALRLKIPFVRPEDISLTRAGEDLIIGFGGFKRHVPLPRTMQRLTVADAQIEAGTLTVTLADSGAMAETVMEVRK